MEIRDWYSKAYAKVTEIAEKPLLCDESYFKNYLTWANFVTKFVLPTIILVGCNVMILLEVNNFIRYFFKRQMRY